MQLIDMTFGELDEGDVFTCDNKNYRKLYGVNNNYQKRDNAVCLSIGVECYIPDDCEVLKIEK